MNTLIYKEKDLESVVDALIPVVEKNKIITFQGPLGAGKTTLIKSLFDRFGVDPNRVTSPTFSYMHQYELGAGVMAFHFDLYRLSSIDDFYALGFDEYLRKTNRYLFIEWPEVIESLLKKYNFCSVVIDYDDDFEKRIISWSENKID